MNVNLFNSFEEATGGGAGCCGGGGGGAQTVMKAITNDPIK
jgi:hypothetical protein